jgi:hypothetical protein
MRKVSNSGAGLLLRADFQFGPGQAISLPHCGLSPGGSYRRCDNYGGGDKDQQHDRRA